MTYLKYAPIFVLIYCLIVLAYCTLSFVKTLKKMGRLEKKIVELKK